MAAIAINRSATTHDAGEAWHGLPSACGLQETLEALPAAVVVLDEFGMVRESNRSAAGFLDGPLTGCVWSDIVRREFLPAGSCGGELRLRDGRWLNLTRRPLGRDGGEILLLTDVSENRRLMEILDRRHRLAELGEMTARLAHQLRTPLASALLYTSRLSVAVPDQRHLVEKLTLRLQELGHMMDDMLGFARGARPAQQRIAVATLFEEVAECFAPGPRRDAISIAPARGEITIEVDRDAIKGALVNLVNNALQACDSEPRVELGAERRKNCVFLTVTDNGHGVTADAMSRLFEPFFTTRPQGSGLGLAVVRTVAKAHGGDVLVESGPAGATFAICLPSNGAPQ